MRTTVVPLTLLERSRAYAPRLAPGHALCGLSAAAVWGMWLPRGVDSRDVEVVAIGKNRPPRARGVRGRHATRASLALVEGIPVTWAAETWCSLGEVLSLDELIAAGDSLVRRRGARCTLDQLVEAVRVSAGRRGMTMVKRALPHVRARCDSPRETTLRLLLVRAGLPEPEVNPRVSRPGERERFGDLVFRRWRVIAEYDGKHHGGPKQLAKDVLRLEELARAGWTVIRVLSEHFDDPAGIVARVEAALRDGGWRGRASKSQLLRASSVGR